jgi:hypothetical protein
MEKQGEKAMWQSAVFLRFSAGNKQSSVGSRHFAKGFRLCSNNLRVSAIIHFKKNLR